MGCTNSGKKIDDHTSFYSNRSAQCYQPVQKGLQSSAKKNLKKHVWWTCGIVCGLALMVAIILLAQNGGLEKQVAQQKLDAMLATVYQESSSDNFVVEALAGNVTIQVDSVYVKEGNYIASCIVSSPDVASAIGDYVGSLTVDENASYTDVVKELTDVINSASIITETFEVRFIQTQDDWHPIIPEEMVAFCCGNVHELLPLIYGILEGSGS